MSRKIGFLTSETMISNKGGFEPNNKPNNDISAVDFGEMGKDNSAGGKQPLFRLMVTENKDKDFDEIKFVLSFRGMFDGSSSSSSSSSAPLTFPSSLEELVGRTRSILKTLDELQAQELKTPHATDSSKNKEVADCMQRLHRELELYQYIYSRIVRVESLLLIVEEMKKVLSSVHFLKEHCEFLVEFCQKAAELTKEKLTYIRYSGKGKSQTIRDFVTTDHHLLLQENFTMALSFLKLCSKKRASFTTLFFENQSDGISSPPSNVIRRLLTVLGTVGITEKSLDFSHVKQRELEQSYQNGLFEAVSQFLKKPKQELKKEFLIRLSDDLNTLAKGRKSLGASQQLVSVSQELQKILEWVSKHEGVLGDVVSDQVDAVLKEKEELAKEKEKEKEGAASYASSSATTEEVKESDMSDVFYNHVAWTDLNVLQEIGQGAFALVYEAELAGERVAVKKIKEDQKDARTQLFNEVRVMSQLRSSFVVELYGASLRQQSQTIMVMEYLPRGAIFDVLQNPEERISWKMKWKFALEMAEGLNYIHTRHPPIVHRDLKTANFLLSEGWRVKLCDFGLAIPLFPPPPAENCGTVRWTAPEINDSQVYTTKSDVYSYGIILWEVAAREIPWKEETNDSTIKRVAKGDRPQVPPDTPISYEMLMSECWSHKAENRPSFASILEQLKRWGIMEWVESLQGEDNFEKIKIESKKLEAKAKDQSQQRSEMENRQNEADAKVRNMQRLKRDLKIEKDDAERRQREYNQKNTQLERQIAAHQAKLYDVEKQIRVYEARVEDTRKSIQEEREEATSQLNEEIAEVRKKIAEDEEAVKELQDKKKALEEKKQEINRQLNSSGGPSSRALTPTRQRF